MNRNSLVLIFSLVCSASSISGPVAGFVVSPSGLELRAIRGVPGAFAFTPPLTLPDGVTRVRLAPGQAYAIAYRGESPAGILFLTGGAVERFTVIDGIALSPGQVEFSPTGSAAVFFSSTGRVQVLTGLPDNPLIGMTFDAESLPGGVRTMAVSDDGKLLVAASRRAVWSIGPDGSSRLLLSGRDIPSIAVLRAGHTVVAADRGAGTVYSLGEAASGAAPRVLASGLIGIGSLASSSDGTAVFVAQPSAKTVTMIEVASGQTRAFATGDTPASLQPLRNRDTFLISARPGQPGWVFYRDGEDGRTAFVPATGPLPEGAR